MARSYIPRKVLIFLLTSLGLALSSGCTGESTDFGSSSTADTRSTGNGVSEPDADWLNGEWRLVAIDHTRLSQGGAPTLVFGDGGNCWGSTGVNRFSTTFVLEGPEKTRLELGNAAVTRKMGPPEAMAVERLFLERLESAETYEMQGELLHIQSGENRDLTFERAYPESPR